MPLVLDLLTTFTTGPSHDALLGDWGGARPSGHGHVMPRPFLLPPTHTRPHLSRPAHVPTSLPRSSSLSGPRPWQPLPCLLSPSSYFHCPTPSTATWGCSCCVVGFWPGASGFPPHSACFREGPGAPGCPPLRAVTTSVDSHLLPPPCPCFTAHALLVWALGWWMPLLISYVLPQCVRVVWGVVCVWMGIARVCSSRPVPTCDPTMQSSASGVVSCS